jgi:hypothetical protein
MHDTDDIICWGCENPLDEDERESPYDRDGHLWCDDCYHEEFEFTCCWCEEYGDNEDQHRYVVVFDAAACELALPGLYRVDHLPYYSQPLIGYGYILSRAVTWLGFLDALPRAGWYDYPAGHLCLRCQRRALAHVTHATDCGIMAGLCA